MDKTTIKMCQIAFLIELLDKRKMTFAEIESAWYGNDHYADFKFSGKRHFFRLIDEVFDLTGIMIKCDHSTNEYYLANGNALKDGSTIKRILEQMKLRGFVEGFSRLEKYIILENMPSGDNFLKDVISAIRRCRYVTISYKKYDSDGGSKDFYGVPRFLKQQKRRWYLLLERNPSYRHPQKSIITLCLDRFVDVKIEDEMFDDKYAIEMDPYLYGVYAGKGLPPAQHVVVRAHGQRRFYLRDLPMHHSQRVEHEGDDYTDYGYYLRPGNEFIADILAMGGQLEVLEPQSLRGDIHTKSMSIATIHFK